MVTVKEFWKRKWWEIAYNLKQQQSEEAWKQPKMISKYKKYMKKEGNVVTTIRMSKRKLYTTQIKSTA